MASRQIATRLGRSSWQNRIQHASWINQYNHHRYDKSIVPLCWNTAAGTTRSSSSFFQNSCWSIMFNNTANAQSTRSFAKATRGGTPKAPPSKKSNSKSRRLKQKSISTTPLKTISLGDNGRKIMTLQRMKTKTKNILPASIELKNVLNKMHNLKQKMLFQQRSTHDSHGKNHNKTFVATLRTTFRSQELPRIPADAMKSGDEVEFCNTGEARTKQQATALAAMDFVHQLVQEVGVDVLNPPDIQKMRKEHEKEQFREQVDSAKRLLEPLLQPQSRVYIETTPHNALKDHFITQLSLLLKNGTILKIKGPPGPGKQTSRHLAYIAAVTERLPDMMGKEEVEEWKQLIEASPARHIACLTIPPLPEEAITMLEDTMGSPQQHDERMAKVKEMQLSFQRHFEQRMKNSWRRTKEQRNQRFNNEKSTSQAFLQRLQEEEQQHLEKALLDPESSQGVMKAVRDALPITALREEMLKKLSDHQVIVISGGTGSGKSTQCPQYILEDAISKGHKLPRIIVTQPRRIAATSVAERVAQERNDSIGNSVGYSVRMSRQPPREAGGSIEFVTTGVLLRRLINDRTLEGVSHVMMDEVHERDINTDFLLILLKDLIKKRPNLKIILMSATLDAESFSKYFSDIVTTDEVPLLSVPPKPRYPVSLVHLEDVAGETQTKDTSSGEKEIIPSEVEHQAKALLQALDQQLQVDLEEAEAEETAALELEDELEDHPIDDDEYDTEDNPSTDLDTGYEENDSIKRSNAIRQGGRKRSRRRAKSSSRVRSLREAVAMRPKSESLTTNQMGRKASQREISEITLSLLAKLAKHVSKVELAEGHQGSILCFLPGWDEIKAAMALLEDCCSLDLRKKIIIIPLHSTVPKEEQQRVFDPAPEGKMKIILATNIAESSVTINDALAIIDSGLVREMNWDAASGMTTTVTVPTSRASATQRMGRAGRVAPGKCYRLYSRGAWQAMPERPTPEMKRVSLENTCLQTCAMTQDGIQTFLSHALDPPPSETVSFAVHRLKKLGAINDRDNVEGLTPLGRLLSQLPLDPATAKMLLMGCVMQCLDPVLTAAACSASRDPFYSPLGLRSEAQEARRSFSRDSDWLARVNAYYEYTENLETQGWNSTRKWASNNFISPSAMSNITSVKSQLLDELSRSGFIPKNDVVGRRRYNKTLQQFASVNQNADNESLCRAVLLTGMPDNIAFRRQLGHFGTFQTRMEEQSGLHPSSVSFHRKPPKENDVHLPDWFLYQEMALSSQVFLRNCTSMTPEQIMLFGGLSFERFNNAENNIFAPSRTVIDDWLIVDGRSDITIELLASLRGEIDAALVLKVMSPRRALPDSTLDVITTVSETLQMLGNKDQPDDL